MERRARDRITTDILIDCRVPATPRRARIQDLSHSGCKFSLTEGIAEPGATVTLQLADGARVAGQVIWTRGANAGVRFDRPLSGAAAVTLGLEQPAPPAPVVEEPEPEPVVQGILGHWFRKLSSRFA